MSYSVLEVEFACTLQNEKSVQDPKPQRGEGCRDLTKNLKKKEKKRKRKEKRKKERKKKEEKNIKAEQPSPSILSINDGWLALKNFSQITELENRSSPWPQLHRQRTLEERR